MTESKFIALFDDERNRIESGITAAKNKVVNQLLFLIKSVNGVGIRGFGGLTLFFIKIVDLELEIVYSDGQLGACGRFSRAYSLLQEEKALRVYASVSTDIIRICPFIRLQGSGVGIAFSLNPEKYIANLQVEPGILGVKVTTDLLIDQRGLYIYAEGRIGNIFMATLDIFEEDRTSWNEMTFEVNGKFLADADIDGDFGDSYLSALRGFDQRISDEAQNRISQVQGGFQKLVVSKDSCV